MLSNDQNMPRIFVSYKRSDKEKVFPIVNYIESRLSEKCWIDLSGIETSAQFTSKICGAIDIAEVVLFMHSKSHLNIDFEEDWTVKELNYARAKEKRIVLVKIDDSALDNIFLMEFGSKNNIDISNIDQKEKLIKDLSKWLHVEYAGPDVMIDTRHSTINGHKYVDLGLSVKWATLNLGATLDTDTGESYMWGDTEPTYEDTWYDYKFTGNTGEYDLGDEPLILTKYNGEDGKRRLEAVDDAVTSAWGAPWRIPTRDEMQELISKCIFTRKGDGIQCKGPNGKTIMFPSWATYWASTKNDTEKDADVMIIVSGPSHKEISTVFYDHFMARCETSQIRGVAD